MTTDTIKTAIADLISSGADNYNSIMNRLIDDGLIDSEYPAIYSEDGEYNSLYDQAVQAALAIEIQTQLEKTSTQCSG